MKFISQFLFASFMFLSACSRDNNNVVPANALTSVISQSRWIVSNFRKEGNDQLFLFGGYRFTFGSNTTVTAERNNGAAAQGTWNSSALNGKSILFLDFASTPDFERLNGNWETVELNSGFIRLQMGTDGNNLLSFEVNP